MASKSPGWRYDPKAPPRNEGEPWIEMDQEDLETALVSGNTLAEIAMYLQRSVAEIEAKVTELKTQGLH